jgi:hypothetical protein
VGFFKVFSNCFPVHGITHLLDTSSELSLFLSGIVYGASKNVVAPLSFVHSITHKGYITLWIYKDKSHNQLSVMSTFLAESSEEAIKDVG